MSTTPQIDWGTAQKATPEVDWNTVQKPTRPQPVGPQTLPEAQTASQSLVYSKMFNQHPSDAYQYHDQLTDNLQEMGVDTGSNSIARDIKVGAEGSIFGMMKRNQLPETLQDPSMLDSFVSGMSTMISDLPFYLMGGAVGAAAGSEVPVVGNIAGAAVGSFAVPQAIRKALVEGISKGHVQSFGDFIDRIGNVALAGAEGAATGAATYAAGLGTLPGLASKPLMAAGMKHLQQIAAMTILPDLFEGKIPTAQEFAVNAALFAAMHYTAQAAGLSGEAAQKIHAKMMDAYEQHGVHPSDVAAEALKRSQTEPEQDPVDRINDIVREIERARDTGEEKPAEKKTPKETDTETSATSEPPPPLLRPAIKVGEDVTPGVEGEQHADVIDRVEGAPEAEKSGELERGFVDRDGEFHTRDEARAVMREQEPEVAKHWEQVTGDPEAEFHTGDYNEARQRATGVKNAAVDAQREQMGLAPIESPMRSMDPDNWEVAKEDVDSGRLDPLKIAESINKSPRGLSPEETNALNYYRARLSADHKNAMDSIERGREADNPEAERRGREQLADVEDKINKVDEATKRAGTEWGLTGLMRQRMVAQDYSLDRLIQRARIASPNGEVSDTVRQKLEGLSSQLEMANKKVEELQNKKSTEDAQKAVENIQREAKKTERKGERAQVRVELKVEFDNLLKDFDKMITGRVSANPFFDPEVLGLLGKMAKNRIESGLTRIEDIVDDIHGALTNIGHDVTKRDLRDAISGYGKTVEMSKDAIKVALREAKQQGRLISALEDAESKRLPLRSGLQRDSASDRVRELQQQVKQAMRDSGIDVRKSQTPDQQWKTALDSVKTRLKNQITDLNRQIQTRTKTPPREGIVYDEEAKALQEQRDKLKEVLDQVTEEPAKRITATERKIQAAEKNLEELKRKIREKDLTPSPRREGPEAERVTQLKDELSELRKTYQKIKDSERPDRPSAETVKLQSMEKSMEELERRIREGDVSPSARREGPQTEQVSAAQERLDNLRKSYAEMKKGPGLTEQEKIELATKGIQKSIDEYERRIRDNDLTPAQRRAGQPERPEVSALRERLDDLHKIYREMKKAAEPKKSPEQIALQRLKTYTKNRIADMEQRLQTGDFEKQPQKPVVLDPEAAELKAKASELRDKIDQEIAKQKWSNASPSEKALHYFSKWWRFNILTSPHTFGKLGAAAMYRMGATPIEELLGGVLGQIPGVKGVAERAPFEGKPSISAEAKALSQAFQKATAEDVWSMLKTGKTSLDKLFGEGGSKTPPSALDFIGNLHGALKVLPKRAEFFRRLEIGTQWALDHNLDIQDPKVQSSLTAGAYEEANRSIFMDSNVVASAWNGMMNYLHGKGASGRALEAVGKFMFPIVKVPANFAAEVLQYSPGSLPWYTIQLFKVLTDENRMGKSAMDNLTLHDMDNIMRGLKKGSAGLALMAIGYGLRNSLTGYYKPQGKRMPGEPGVGTVTIGGATIPSWLLENPALETLQLAATAGHVWDHYQQKGEPGGFVAGSLFAGKAAVQRLPFLDTPYRMMQQTRTPESTGVWAGQMAADLLVPLGARMAAEMTDPLGEEGRKRKPTTPQESIEMDIPGLRENVPMAVKKRKGFSILGME